MTSLLGEARELPVGVSVVGRKADGRREVQQRFGDARFGEEGDGPVVVRGDVGGIEREGPGKMDMRLGRLTSVVEREREIVVRAGIGRKLGRGVAPNGDGVAVVVIARNRGGQTRKREDREERRGARAETREHCDDEEADDRRERQIHAVLGHRLRDERDDAGTWSEDEKKPRAGKTESTARGTAVADGY